MGPGTKFFLSPSTVAGPLLMAHVVRRSWDGWAEGRDAENSGLLARLALRWHGNGWGPLGTGHPFPVDEALDMRLLTVAEAAARREALLAYADTVASTAEATKLRAIAESYPGAMVETFATDDESVPMSFMEYLADQCGGLAGTWERG